LAIDGHGESWFQTCNEDSGRRALQPRPSVAEPNAAGWQKLWANHRTFTVNKMKENSKQLELKMAEDPKKTQKLIAKKVEW